MDITQIIASIESSSLGEWMRSSVKAMPVVEAVHVMAVALLFGTILIVDLRLLGLASVHRAYTRVSGELLSYAWAAFVIAAVTGAMMFTANAATYYDNTPFRWKMLVLLLAGLNMAVFQKITRGSVASWDNSAKAPPAARAAGVLSLAFWTSVIFLGRWVGFTKGYDFDIPDVDDIDFDFGLLPLQLGQADVPGWLDRVALLF